MPKLLIRWIINAVALWVALNYVPGIHHEITGWLPILGLAFIFGLVNALVRPLLNFLTCPFIILTLGLGTLLINTLLFWLSGQVGEYFGVGFSVEGFWPAFWGALVVSLVSVVLTVFVKDDGEGKRRPKADH